MDKQQELQQGAWEKCSLRPHPRPVNVGGICMRTSPQECMRKSEKPTASHQSYLSSPRCRALSPCEVPAFVCSRVWCFFQRGGLLGLALTPVTCKSNGKFQRPQRRKTQCSKLFSRLEKSATRVFLLSQASTVKLRFFTTKML